MFEHLLCDRFLSQSCKIVPPCQRWTEQEWDIASPKGTSSEARRIYHTVLLSKWQNGECFNESIRVWKGESESRIMGSISVYSRFTLLFGAKGHLQNNLQKIHFKTCWQLNYTHFLDFKWKVISVTWIMFTKSYCSITIHRWQLQ